MWDLLRKLPKEEMRMIGTDVQWAWPVGKPLVDSMGQGLWEIRSSLDERIARVFFIVHHEEIILLHGIIQKKAAPLRPTKSTWFANDKPFTCNPMKTNPKAKAPKSDNLHRGGSFSDFLKEEGVLPEVTVLALKRGGLSLE